MKYTLPLIRRMFFAGLVGAPVPVIIGIVIAVGFGFFDTQRGAGGAAYFLAALENAAKSWPLPLAEGVLGVVYGAVAVFDGEGQAPNLTRGTILGAFFLFMFGFPFIFWSWALIAMLGVTFVPLRIGDALVERQMFATAAFFAHVLGGAVAGFHVERYRIWDEASKRKRSSR
jgi:hypothetical protein